jgi:hypothetical protein
MVGKILEVFCTIVFILFWIMLIMIVIKEMNNGKTNKEV